MLRLCDFSLSLHKNKFKYKKMIIRVRIRNFLSFNKEIEFSMIPGQGRLKKSTKLRLSADIVY